MAERTRNQTLTVFMTGLTSPIQTLVLVREHASDTVKTPKRNLLASVPTPSSMRVIVRVLKSGKASDETSREGDV